ncbi:MAG: xylulokinase, partial [Subtercola sp.]|nr:xylulokinase [Subtercola sp.]
MGSDAPASAPGAGRRRLAIGLDVGTSSVKATVVTSEGETRSYGSAPYRSAAPVPDGVEQDPYDWWAGTLEVLHGVLGDFGDIAATTTTIGLTGQMHTSVLVDEGGSVIRPAMLWSDKRAVAECEELTLA